MQQWSQNTKIVRLGRQSVVMVPQPANRQKINCLTPISKNIVVVKQVRQQICPVRVIRDVVPLAATGQPIIVV